MSLRTDTCRSILRVTVSTSLDVVYTMSGCARGGRARAMMILAGVVYRRRVSRAEHVVRSPCRKSCKVETDDICAAR